MKNIHWVMADGSMAYTCMVDPAADSRAHAEEGKARGDFPSDWNAVAFDDPAPPFHMPQEIWHWDGEHVTMHVAKARAWHKDRLRKERAPLFAPLDVQFMRGIEQGHDTLPIAAEKQRLRDITKVVDTLPTWEEMAAVKP